MLPCIHSGESRIGHLCKFSPFGMMLSISLCFDYVGARKTERVIQSRPVSGHTQTYLTKMCEDCFALCLDSFSLCLFSGIREQVGPRFRQCQGLWCFPISTGERLKDGSYLVWCD